MKTQATISTPLGMDMMMMMNHILLLIGMESGDIVGGMGRWKEGKREGGKRGKEKEKEREDGRGRGGGEGHEKGERGGREGEGEG